MNAPSEKTVRWGIIVAAVLLVVFLIWSSRMPSVSKSDADDINRKIMKATCADFEERVLWSSGYSNDPGGSTQHLAWQPEHGCIQGQECFLKHLGVRARFLYGGEDKQTDAYVQISEPDESVCDAPEQGTYTRYIAHELLRGEKRTTNWYCGRTKNADGRCGIDSTIDPKPHRGCYGIRAHAPQYALVDVFLVNYTVCWWEDG